MDCSEVAAISSQTERIEMEEGRDQNQQKHGGVTMRLSKAVVSQMMKKGWRNPLNTSSDLVQPTKNTGYVRAYGTCNTVMWAYSGLSGFIPKKPTLYNWC